VCLNQVKLRRSLASESGQRIVAQRSMIVPSMLSRGLRKRETVAVFLGQPLVGNAQTIRPENFLIQLQGGAHWHRRALDLLGARGTTPR